MHDARVVTCRASNDYHLWLQFDDGLEGNVYLGNLLNIGCFTLWRDVRVFMTARVDSESNTVVWAAGVRLDPDILWHDLATREPEFRQSPGFATRYTMPPAARDAEFQRFMHRVLRPVRRRRGGSDAAP